MIKWTEQDYERIYDAAFAPDYPGYKPNVVELPNGDGRADVSKRYSHLALKYAMPPVLEAAFWRGYATALECWVEDGYPFHGDVDLDPAACALRVLEYPAGSGSERHTDFDLFTVNLWRSHPARMCGPNGRGVGRGVTHTGELWQELEGYYVPDEHWVEPHPTETQRSLVFFALPSHDTRLPSGITVGEWLAERIARSRSYR